jgi:hypothetical protein
VCCLGVAGTYVFSCTLGRCLYNLFLHLDGAFSFVQERRVVVIFVVVLLYSDLVCVW